MFIFCSVGRLLNMWWYVFGLCKYTKSRLMKISCPFQSKLPTLLCKAWCCNSCWFPGGAKNSLHFHTLGRWLKKPREYFCCDQSLRNKNLFVCSYCSSLLSKAFATFKVWCEKSKRTLEIGILYHLVFSWGQGRWYICIRIVLKIS